MKPPKSTPIGGKRIKIRVMKMEDWGEYFHDKGEICVSDKATGRDLLETLRHEVLEASLHIGGVAWSDKYEQEVVVRCIEGIFFPAWDALIKKLIP